MSFLIPNNILDKLVCDFCSKFLSVTPVKVFPNGKIQCGRCTSEPNGGVVSLYNSIAEKSIFKCVNRFEGCKELLTTTDVLKHENICQSKEYTCPICCQLIPTYLMISHFQSFHRENILENPHFIVKLGGEMETFFLYQHGENLFFIMFELWEKLSPEPQLINFSCSHLGEFASSKNVTVKFTILCGNIFTEGEILCKMYPSFGNQAWCLRFQNDLMIMFCIQYPKSNNQTLINLPLNNLQLSNGEMTDIDEKVQYFSGLKLVTLYFQQRDIILTDTFIKAFPDVSIVKGSTIRCSVSNEKLCIHLSCFVCSNVSRVQNDNLIYFADITREYQYCCWVCSKSLTTPNKKIFTSVNLLEISYFCQWGCGKFFSIAYLKQHEETCENQLPQQCPVKFCKLYFKMYEINNHFQKKHSNLVVPGIGDVYGSATLIELDPSCPPLRFFVASHTYICVEFVWKQPLWNISLSCKLPNVEPRALILSNDSEPVCKYVIKGNGSIRHMSKLNIKCYLAHPDRV